MTSSRRVAALATVPLLLLAACGSESDKDRLTKIIKDGGKDPATICPHLAPALLKTYGTVKTCQTQARSADDGKDAVDIKQLEIDGDSATASISGAQGVQTVTFAKAKDEWVVTAIK